MGIYPPVSSAPWRGWKFPIRSMKVHRYVAGKLIDESWDIFQQTSVTI